MRAGLAPKVQRSKDSHLDLVERKRADREGDYLERSFGDLTARRSPLGRLEVTFPDGFRQADMSKLSYREMVNAICEYPALKDALTWANWTLPYIPDAG